jgi:hypothetical protein
MFISGLQSARNRSGTRFRRLKLNPNWRLPASVQEWGSGVIDTEVATDDLLRLGDLNAGPQADIYLIDRFLQPLDEHVVNPATFPVQADLDFPRTISKLAARIA